MGTRGATSLVFALACGLHFAVLQFSYFFLMEAYLSSQSLSYFVALFFWLCGFLAGLSIAGERWFRRVLIAGVITYYVAWSLTSAIPFSRGLYPAAALCSTVSGLAPGCFFPFMARRFATVKGLLFHENNGFILGILISLKASIHCGSWFLTWGPLLGGTLVLLLGLAGGWKDPESRATQAIVFHRWGRPRSKKRESPRSAADAQRPTAAWGPENAPARACC